MIKAVIFDYGGVIKSSHACKNETASAFKISQSIASEVAKPLMDDFRKGIITEASFWKLFSEKLGRPIPKNSDELWRKCYEKTFHIYPIMTEFIGILKKRKIKTAILSVPCCVVNAEGVIR